MIGRKVAVLVGAFLFATTTFAQKDYTKDAKLAVENGQYFYAIELYKKAYPRLKGAEEKAKVLFEIGRNYYKVDDMEQAEVWIEKAITANYSDPIAVLYFADVKKALAKYDEAIAEYTKYSSRSEDGKGEKGVKECEMAQRLIDEPSRYEVNPVPLLNSEAFELTPVICDKKSLELYFASTRPGSTGEDQSTVTGQPFSDIYHSKRDKNGRWSEPVPLGLVINTNGSEAAVTFDDKKATMYFTRCEKGDKGERKSCAIYVSKKMGVDWGEAVKLPFGSDSVSIGHPALMTDEKTLIFSGELPGGKGGKDLWYSVYDEKADKWTDPVNLGSDINTAKDELYPAPKGSGGDITFSSNGHPGLGGFDTYSAKSKGVNQWGNIENLGYPLNSAGNELGIYFDGNYDRGYLTSDRKGGLGSDDIYEFYLPDLVFEIQGIVIDMDTREPLAGAVVSLVGTDGSTGEVTTDIAGAFKFEKKEGGARYILPNTSYVIKVDGGKDYLSAKGKETTVNVTRSMSFRHEYELIHIKKKEIHMPEVLYAVGKADLLESSKDSLNFLYNILVDNPQIVVELMAHTDTRGDDKSNMKLSEARAQSCVDYLVSKGIDASRLKPKGYGETDPLILDADISKMNTEQEKESAHQKNRRTRFRVLSTDHK